MDKDVRYVFNDKVYNITQSEKLYEYNYHEYTGTTIFNGYKLTREVTIKLYKSLKGNLYQAMIKSGKIVITDTTEEKLKGLLLERNELDLLGKLYPEELKRLEEV